MRPWVEEIYGIPPEQVVVNMEHDWRVVYPED